MPAPDANDPFDLLGLAPDFDLDADAVRRAWLARSAALHPDRGGPGDDAERARIAAVLNDAKRTLEDPERRAEALLARLGGPAKDADKSLPPTLLMEFMEAREALDEARAARDRDAVARWRAWALDRRDRHVAEVSRLFRGAGAAPDDALRAVRRELNAWRYAERMLEQVDEP